MPRGYSEVHRLFCPDLGFPCLLCFPGCLTTSASADLTVTMGVELAEPPSPTLPRASRSRVSGKLRRSTNALSKASS